MCKKGAVAQLVEHRSYMKIIKISNDMRESRDQTSPALTFFTL